MEIKIIIEKTIDHYSAYAENIEGIYGAGDTLDEVKTSIKKSIELFKEYNDDIPDAIKGDYELYFKLV